MTMRPWLQNMRNKMGGTEPASTGWRGLLALIESRVLWPIATVILLVAVSIMMFEALGRFFFSSSFFWAEEAVRFLVVWSMFLTMAIAGRQNRHIRTEILVSRLPPFFRRLANGIACLTGVAFSGFLLWGSGIQLQQYHWLGMMTESTLDLPMWVIYAVVPIGAALLLAHYVGSLASVVAGHDPFAGNDHDSGGGPAK